MRILIIPATFAMLLLAGCSPQDQEKASQDAHRAGQEIKEGATKAGREIKKDLHVADEKVTESLEKGKAAKGREGIQERDEQRRA